MTRAHRAGIVVEGGAALLVALLASCSGVSTRRDDGGPGDGGGPEDGSGDCDANGDGCGACGTELPDDMVCVRAGAFLMGHVDAAWEAPLHEVYLDAFLIDRTEVTNDGYRECVEAGGCDAPLDQSSVTREHYYDSEAFGSFPLVAVHWQQAEGYCAWRGRRLPTEAEWEKAARGGCDLRGGLGCEEETDAPPYPWGTEPPTCALASFRDECGTDTGEVGSLPDGASIYGALDMIGNVQEWVADWYAESYYDWSPSENPTGPTEEQASDSCGVFDGPCRVRRGSFFGHLDGEPDVPLSVRVGRPPYNSGWNVGFRCAADVM